MNKEELLFCKKIEIMFQMYALGNGVNMSNFSITLLRRFLSSFCDEINIKGVNKNEKNN